MTRGPIGFLHENDRDWGHFGCLEERQQFEQFVERAKPTGEDDECVGAHCKVKFSDGKIVKLKGQVRCRIRIGLLLVRQPDVEPDRRRTSIRSAPVCRFHDTPTAAGRDHVVSNAVGQQRTTSLRRNPPELPGFLIPSRRLSVRPRDRPRWQ
jgi:hypothetical protein